MSIIEIRRRIDEYEREGRVNSARKLEELLDQLIEKFVIASLV